MKSPCVIIQGTEINREEIIKYVCNKLGGAHYDESRKIGDKLSEKYVLLDTYRNSLNIINKDAIYFELLSIGQKIVNSKDVQELKKVIETYLSENREF